MKDILRKLFYGKFVPYENIAPKNHQEYTAINDKINDEEIYFKNLLSVDDFNRLEKLERLYTESSGIEAESAYLVGFRLAVMIMAEVYVCNGNLPDIDKILDAEK